jgi:hypothetical protein
MAHSARPVGCWPGAGRWWSMVAGDHWPSDWTQLRSLRHPCACTWAPAHTLAHYCTTHNAQRATRSAYCAHTAAQRALCPANHCHYHRVHCTRTALVTSGFRRSSTQQQRSAPTAHSAQRTAAQRHRHRHRHSGPGTRHEAQAQARQTTAHGVASTAFMPLLDTIRSSALRAPVKK